MKNAGKNLSPNKLLRYLLFFSLSLLLILGGIYLYAVILPDFKLKRELKLIKDTNQEAKNDYEQNYKEKNDPEHSKNYEINDSIVQINEGNLQEIEYLLEKLPSANLDYKLITKKSKQEFRKFLIETRKKINKKLDQQILEEKTKKEKEKIILEALKIRNSLSKLSRLIEPINKEQKNQRLKEQDDWFKKYHPHQTIFPTSNSEVEKEAILKEQDDRRSDEDKKVVYKLKNFFKHFYGKFIKENNLSEPDCMQPTKTLDGKDITPETDPKEIKRKINDLKIRYPKYNKKMVVEWKDFLGWIKGESGSEEGSITLGLTHHDGIGYFEDDGTLVCQKRIIYIMLNNKLPFSRKGKNYDTWITRDSRSSRVGWITLIETIAHELAHAIINFTDISYREGKEKGGHGTKHRNYTKKLERMIKNDPEYQILKKFWFKK